MATTFARRAAQHVLRFAADSDDFAAGLVDGHDGWLVDDDAFAVREHQRVCGPQINCQVGRKKD